MIDHSDCTNLALGAAYCVSPPPAVALPTTTSAPSGPTTTTTTTTSAGPTPTIAAGSWTNCTTYYQVQSGDNCPGIESKFSISQSDFLLWNPEITGDCSSTPFFVLLILVADDTPQTWTYRTTASQALPQHAGRRTRSPAAIIARLSRARIASLTPLCTRSIHGSTRTVICRSGKVSVSLHRQRCRRTSPLGPGQSTQPWFHVPGQTDN